MFFWTQKKLKFFYNAAEIFFTKSLEKNKKKLLFFEKISVLRVCLSTFRMQLDISADTILSSVRNFFNQIPKLINQLVFFPKKIFKNIFCTVKM